MRYLFCVLLVGCSSPSTAGGPVPTDGGTILDDATARSDSSPASDSSSTKDSMTAPADAAPAIPFCQMSCSVAADCAQTGAAFDADNYACESGLCRWLGCKSHAECESTFMSTSYGCFDVSGTKSCVKKCSAPADCVTPGSTLYDADNWSCTGGGCRWNGCNGDGECVALGAGYVCRDVAGLRNCIKQCSTPSDCATASAAFDADNYACEGGLCKYTGCNSDTECRTSLMKSNYVCR